MQTKKEAPKTNLRGSQNSGYLSRLAISCIDCCLATLGTRCHPLSPQIVNLRGERSTPEYLLLKRSFGTYTRIVSATGSRHFQELEIILGLFCFVTILHSVYFEPLKIPFSLSSLLMRLPRSPCCVPKSRLQWKLRIST